jgi:hypothetical protein
MKIASRSVAIPESPRSRDGFHCDAIHTIARQQKQKSKTEGLVITQNKKGRLITDSLFTFIWKP